MMNRSFDSQPTVVPDTRNAQSHSEHCATKPEAKVPEPKKELGGASDIIEYKKKAKLESLITECLD